MSTASPIRLDLRAVDRILHELRKPLASIQAFTDLLEEEISGTLNDEQHDYARTVLGKVDQLDARLQQLRTLAALASGEYRVSLHTVRVEQILERIESRHASTLHRRGVRFYLELPDPELELRTDPDALVAAFGHVLENGARLTPDGGEICIAAHGSEGTVRVEIRDSGPGIRSSEIEQVFAPFHRTGVRGDHTHPHAMGIGLALARGIVEAMGGSLQARARTSGGTSFLFDLPAKESSSLVHCGGERGVDEGTASRRDEQP